MTKTTLQEAFFFLDTVSDDLGPINRTNGTHYLQTELGFNVEESIYAYDAWSATRTTEGCAEDRVDAFLTSELNSLKARGYDYFFALVDDDGKVANEDRKTLAAAKKRKAKVIKMTPDEMAFYWPGQSRSFTLDDITPEDLAYCGSVVALTIKLNTTILAQ